MTHLSVALRDRWPRCPQCGAVQYPGFGTDHRPGCELTHTDPDHWSPTP